MSAREIATLARAARKAGVSTLLQLEIAGHLLEHGEMTLEGLSTRTGTTLETVTHAAAQLETQGGATATACRQAVGFSLVRLTEAAAKAFAATVPPLRSKTLGLRYTR